MAPKKNETSELLNRVEVKLDLFKEHFDGNMTEVSKRFSEVQTQMNGIDGILVKQQAILDEHVRRTNLLETKVENDKRILEGKIEPLEKQAFTFKLALKLIAGLAAAGGGAIGIKEIVALLIG